MIDEFMDECRCCCSVPQLKTLGVQLQCCFTSTETVRTIMDGESRTATWTFTQLLSFEAVQCCFLSTEAVGTIRDGEPKTATSTFTQLLNSAFGVTYRHVQSYTDGCIP